MTVAPDAFRGQPVLHGKRVSLEPLGIEHFDGLFAMLSDPEGRRMTATTKVFEEEFARTWISTRKEHDDRADYAIVRAEDDMVLGQGYGTEASGLVLDYAFDGVGLRRVDLEVYDYNPRARRSYEKCGFVREGVRRETQADVAGTREVVAAAFGDEPVAALLDAMRESAAWLDLSFVAEAHGEVVGHVSFTRGWLDAPRRVLEVLVLSPLSVRPDLQRQGVGSRLVRETLQVLEGRDEPLVFLEGSPSYYPRLGFVPGGTLGLTAPSVRIPDVAFQVVTLPTYDSVGLRDPGAGGVG